MKLTFTCNHCENENELIISTMKVCPKNPDVMDIITPKRTYQVEYFDTHLQHWQITAKVFVSLQHFRDSFLKEDLPRISKMRLLDAE